MTVTRINPDGSMSINSDGVWEQMVPQTRKNEFDFRIGDRIRTIDSSGAGIAKFGDVGEVTGTDYFAGPFTLVTIQTDDGREYTQYAERFVLEGPSPVLTEPTIGLTEAEHKAMGLTAELWNLLVQEVIDRKGTVRQDSAEIALHIHNIQHAILAQAAARAYPEQYRLLGGDGPRGQ